MVCISYLILIRNFSSIFINIIPDRTSIQGFYFKLLSDYSKLFSLTISLGNANPIIIAIVYNKISGTELLTIALF
jgi:hypothetical protein